MTLSRKRQKDLKTKKKEIKEETRKEALLLKMKSKCRPRVKSKTTLDTPSVSLTRLITEASALGRQVTLSSKLLS